MNAEEYAENITRGTDDNWTRMEVRLVARMAFDDGTATVSSETPLDLDARIVNEMRRAVLLDAVTTANPMGPTLDTAGVSA